MSQDYEVGYGKPPKKNQWSPGTSGNPVGSSAKAKKKKELKTLAEFLALELNELVEPTFNGKKEKMPLGRAIAKSLAYGISQASIKEKMAFFAKCRDLGIEEAQRVLIEQESGDDNYDLSEADQRLLAETSAFFNALEEQPDKGEGWESGYYDLKCYYDENGETAYKIVPGPASKNGIAGSST